MFLPYLALLSVSCCTSVDAYVWVSSWDSSIPSVSTPTPLAFQGTSGMEYGGQINAAAAVADSGRFLSTNCASRDISSGGLFRYERSQLYTESSTGHEKEKGWY